jgi:hypothetical protein
VIDALENQQNQLVSEIEVSKPVFIFISAAEAGWTIETPVPWLNRYLTAKRQVEDKLKRSAKLRAVVFRPSLIWTWQRPAALLSVVPFYVASKLGVPFVDRPVLLEELTRAIVEGIKQPNVEGIQRYYDIDKLCEAKAAK